MALKVVRENGGYDSASAVQTSTISAANTSKLSSKREYNHIQKLQTTSNWTEETECGERSKRWNLEHAERRHAKPNKSRYSKCAVGVRNSSKADLKTA